MLTHVCHSGKFQTKAFLLDSHLKHNFLYPVEVAKMMIRSRLPLTWQSKEHDIRFPHR